MKFRFKIQQYQTDAVDSVVRVFDGQHYSDGVSYIRDLGEQEPVMPPQNGQLSMFPDPQLTFDDVLDDTGYKNENLRLNADELLQNIRTIQSENNIRLSDHLVRELGCCSLDVEMETGTGKTYSPHRSRRMAAARKRASSIPNAMNSLPAARSTSLPPTGPSSSWTSRRRWAAK